MNAPRPAPVVPDLQAAGGPAELLLTAPRSLDLVRGEGARVWDAAGRPYIDCVGGHGAAILGHGHPQLTAAIAGQAGRLMSCPVSFGNEVRRRCLERLTAAAPAGLDRAFLCNSGTEAVEAALKFARLATGRTGFVAAIRGFHGRTMGALSATFQPQYRRDFEPLVPGFGHVPFGDEAALAAAVDATTAAVILEVVQGEGGVHPAPDGYLAAARRICDRQGALLIIDEVQTGLGRTGRLFAVEHAGVVPDLLCLAKGLAGGFPMGAVLCGAPIPDAVSLHGSTFGGNPVACAAALAVLEVLESDGLVERSARLGETFRAALRGLAHPAVREVRGLGLMVGVELAGPAAPVVRGLQERGVLALPAGRKVVRFLPPLVIRQNDLQAAVSALSNVLAELPGA